MLSRTASYALLVLILGAIYGVGAVWLPTRIVGQQSPLFVAGSTLAVAALFTPIRRSVMTWVDRRFYRSRYQMEQVIHEFSSHLQDQVDPRSDGVGLCRSDHGHAQSENSRGVGQRRVAPRITPISPARPEQVVSHQSRDPFLVTIG